MSKILIVSGFETAQELLTEGMIRYIKQDDTIATVDASDKSGLDTAIAALTADQDIIYVLGNISDTGIITLAQEEALEAKLTAVTGVLVNYTSTNRISGVDMSYQCWNALFSSSTTPSPAVVYTADLLANLSVTEQAQGTYLSYAIKANYEGNLGTQSYLYELWSLLDQGLVPGSNFNAAHTNKLPFVNYSRIVLTDLLNKGLGISSYISAVGGVSPTIDYYSIAVGKDTWEGAINYDTQAITVSVPYGTTVTALVATFDLSENTTAYVAETEQVSATTENDFTTPVTYNLVGDDGELKQFVVTVTGDGGSSENDILTFSFPEQTGAATIDTEAYTVEIEVAKGTTVTALVATFTLSDDAYGADISDVAQVSGTTENDFTNPVTYTVTAQDGTEQDWEITVTVAKE